jgi:signal transduction histidine kinase
MVEMANRTCDRLVALVNDILDLEKTESGQLSIHARPLDAAKVARDALAASEDLARRQGVALSLAVPDQERLRVLADDRRLEQVLGNLLSNAIKFSPEGGTVRVALQPLQHKVRFEVTDEGPGIPPAFREQVFEKFAQADATDRRAQGGSGLGLTICKALVERMQGQIGFESPPVGRTHGTMLWFELPTPDAPPPPRRFEALVV